MINLKKIKDRIISDEKIEQNDAYALENAPLDEFILYADEIRNHFCGNKFDLCSIINAKSGKCSENCKYCAQSSFYNTDVEKYDLLDSDTIVNEAVKNAQSGVLRFSIVTSGRKPSQRDLNKICSVINKIKEKSKIKICASLGLLEKSDLVKLKEAGLTRIHNNLETSKNNFKNICTTHTFDDKVKTISAAQELGLEVCSGGIFGMGETWKDRIDMALVLKKLNILSIPLNFLCAIKGTPFENNDVLSSKDILRICAIYRFINPKAFIRLAGGRYLTGDNGLKCLKAGINSLITGDMLTTCGASVVSDLKMAKEQGYEVKL